MDWVSMDSFKDNGNKPKAIIAIDFDGTIVEHEYPAIGREIPGAVEVMRELIEKGYRLILLTMRSGQELDEAIRYCNQKKIDFWAVNHNPEQEKWTSSRKVYANVYIDDSGLGVPLARSSGTNNRARVDWAGVRRILTEWEVLEPVQTEADSGDGVKRIGDI